MPQDEPSPEAFGIMAEPSKQFLESVTADQQAEDADPERRRKRERWIADLQATYDRHLGRNWPEVKRQEDLLKDARAWAQAALHEIAPAAKDVLELKQRIVKQTWDQFVPKHRYYSDLLLGYREFDSALWEEGWPSLEDRAKAAIQAAISLGETGEPARLEALPPKGIVEGTMADGPEQTFRASVEASLARELPQLINLPSNEVERQLETYAKRAMPHGTEQGRAEFKRHWLERLEFERKRLERERMEFLRLLGPLTVKPLVELEDSTKSVASVLPPYWENPTPLFHFAKWELKGLRSEDQSQIKHDLRAIHAAFLEGKTSDQPQVDCWRSAYDGFAKVLFEARLLTVDLVTNGIPAMVADAGATGRWHWGRYSSNALGADFTERFGNEFFVPGYIHSYFLPNLAGRIFEWQGKLPTVTTIEDPTNTGAGHADLPTLPSSQSLGQSAHSMTDDPAPRAQGGPPPDRPRIAFRDWSEIPDDHPVPIRSGQTGFYLANDGGAAYEVTVEPFEVEPSVRARGDTLARIAERGEAFALVWLEGYSGLAVASEKWDLRGALARADAKSGGGRGTYGGPDYGINVSVTYRDADSLWWYRSSARLTFIRSQGRISFGPTTHEPSGPSREAVTESRSRGEPAKEARTESRQPTPQQQQPDQEHTADHLVPAAVPLATSCLQILREAMDQQGLNPPKLAGKIQAILKRKKGKQPKADRSTVYRIMKGITKKPQPKVREALIEALGLKGENASIVRRGLGGTGVAQNFSEQVKPHSNH